MRQTDGIAGWLQAEMGMRYPWLLAKLQSHRTQCDGGESPEGFASAGDELVCNRCRQAVASKPRDIKSNQTVGVIGFGAFGQFLGKHLGRAFHQVTVSDLVPREQEAAKAGLRWAGLEEVANSETVVLAVPLQNLEQLLRQIAPCLKPNALVVDVCSVKQASIGLMLKHLPTSVEVLGTHPLFGPQSAKAGVEGHRIVICRARITEPHAARVQSLLADGFGLKVIETDAETHDREMASVQALMHFIARGLAECGIRRSEMATVAFDNLCDAAELLGSDSWELFQTIEIGNPFAAEARRRFMEALTQLEEKIAAGQDRER